MTAYEYFGDWCKVIDVKEAEKAIKRLSKVPVCPAIKDVFKAFRICPYKDLKVVIIGQDPYPDLFGGKPRATGIAFANSTDIPEDKLSPSLKILKESVIDFTLPHYSVNFDSSLEKWGRQGVLLLNAALTCKTGYPESHMLLWRPFIKSLLSNLSKCTTGIVYILMGNVAQTFEGYINKEFNYIFKIKHPAYYAREDKPMPSDIWREVNNILYGQNNFKINWYEETES